MAQIKANYSSGDDISSDEETQEDESESEGDKEVKQSNEDNATDENGKYAFVLSRTFVVTLCVFLKAQVCSSLNPSDT